MQLLPNNSARKIPIYLRLPNSSKFFFNAYSVGIIVPIMRIICTTVRIAPTIPTVSVPFPSTKAIMTTEISISISPQMNQSLPIYAWANFHVSLFIMDLFVRYPKVWFISLGALFENNLPNTIIVIGTIKTMTNINTQ